MLRKITEDEYRMMDAVQGMGGRADCQDDRELFCAMRCCQFQSWNDETLESYAEDLRKAAESGRNLVTEKYARMMEQTDPVNYEKIKDFLPPVL